MHNLNLHKKISTAPSQDTKVSMWINRISNMKSTSPIKILILSLILTLVMYFIDPIFSIVSIICGGITFALTILYNKKYNANEMITDMKNFSNVTTSKEEYIKHMAIAGKKMRKSAILFTVSNVMSMAINIFLAFGIVVIIITHTSL